MSKSEIVVPQLTGQKEGVVVVVPMPCHLPGAQAKQYTRKEEDSTTYTSSHSDKFAYGTEVEETDEADGTDFKPMKKDSVSVEDDGTIRESDATGAFDSSTSVQSKVHYFENCFKKVCSYLHILPGEVFFC